MTEPPEPRTLAAFLEANAAERGAREALVTEAERLTHAALRAEARDVARSMLALGLRKGDAVGVLMGNDADWVRLFYAAALIGAVTVPANTRFKPGEIAFALRQAECRAVFAAGRFLNIDFAAYLREAEPALDIALPGKALPALRHAILIGEDVPRAALSWHAFRARRVLAAELDPAMAQVTPHDPLLIQFTSGTTAYPKGVLLTHHNMLGNAVCCAARLGIVEEDRYLNCRPFFHVAGSTLSLLVSLVTGATMVTPPTFEAGAALRLLERERCTATSGNDSIFQMLLAHPAFDRGRLHLSKGWAAAGPETMRMIMDRLGIRDLCWAYGLSEASPNVVLSDYRDPADIRISGRAKPHPGVEIRIAHPETGALLPPGVPGEIQVRGWTVMQGYVNNPDATARALTLDGWLRTGDLGTLDAEGRLGMIGRLKDVIRVGGENVAPAEVEEVLIRHPAVAMAQVVGVPDARLGEVPMAFVQLRPGAHVGADDLLAWLKPQLANFRLPRRLRLVNGFEAIGMTASGKVQKTRLREHALALIAEDGGGAPP
ncbi:MAG TPA: AMP-binding protein [Acetobacteraceae bacterium]|nr:AMP-binding protein [Acetobacteraceae bacterium]